MKKGKQFTDFTAKKSFLHDLDSFPSDTIFTVLNLFKKFQNREKSL